MDFLDCPTSVHGRNTNPNGMQEVQACPDDTSAQGITKNSLNNTMSVKPIGSPGDASRPNSTDTTIPILRRRAALPQTMGLAKLRQKTPRNLQKNLRPRGPWRTNVPAPLSLHQAKVATLWIICMSYGSMNI